MSDKQYQLMIAYSQAAREANREPSPVLGAQEELVKVALRLTEQEQAIITLAGQGKDEGQIATELGVVLPVVIATLRKHYK